MEQESTVVAAMKHHKTACIKLEETDDVHPIPRPMMVPSARHTSDGIRWIGSSGQSCSILFEETVSQEVIHNEVEKGTEESTHPTKFGTHSQGTSSPEDSIFSTRPQCSLGEREFCNFSCSFCLKSFPSKYELIMHVFIHIDGVQPPIYICRSCGKVFPTDDCLNKHLEWSGSDPTLPGGTNEQYDCSDEDEYVRILEGVQVIYGTEEQGVPKRTCKISLNCFNLGDTRSITHNEEKQDQSDTYKKLSTTGKVHTVVFSAKKHHKCDSCGKPFSKLSNLRRHTLTHTGTKAHKCDTCSKSFTQLASLKSHMLIHTGTKPHKCNICGKSFTQLHHLKSHSLTHTGMKPHKCNICAKSFTQFQHFKTHTLTHAGIKPHKCNICGKSFTRLRHLNSHTLTHTGMKPYKCDTCGKCFIDLGTLKRHTLTHTGMKPHKCDICGKCFTELGTLKRHTLTHTGMKAHKCDICGKSFTQLVTLKSHILTHTGVKPYKCDICGKSFTQSGNLKNHILTHWKI